MMASEHGQGLRIVQETPDWIVVDKPAGLLSVPGKGPERSDCVASRVRTMRPAATGPLIVHRLDMDTSGLMVLGLTPESQRALSRQFEDRRTTKAYIALVEGVMEGPEAGEVELPLRLDPGNRPYQVVDHDRGRAAATRWRVIAMETDRTRLRLEPLTGRTHQLRVHCATARGAGGLGHTILGDVLYGTGYRSAADVGRRVAAERLMLHAAELEFTDPVTLRRVRCESAPEF